MSRLLHSHSDHTSEPKCWWSQWRLLVVSFSYYSVTEVVNLIWNAKASSLMSFKDIKSSTSVSRFCQLYAVQGNHRSLTWRVHQSLICNHLIWSDNYLLLLRLFLKRPKSWSKHHSWGEADTKLWCIQNLEEGSRLALEEICPQTKDKWFPSATEVPEKKEPPGSTFWRGASPDPVGRNIHITSLTLLE